MAIFANSLDLHIQDNLGKPKIDSNSQYFPDETILHL